MFQDVLNNLSTILRFDPENPLMFNSGFFIYFFFLVILGYNFVKGSIGRRNFYLMVVSLYFYYKTSGMFVGILLFTTLFDFYMAGVIAASIGKRRKLILALSLIANIGILCYFKYTNFFIESIATVFRQEFNPLNIVLPVGISFFIFQTMSYTIDIYRGVIKPLDRWVDYAFYVTFFPQLVAGPIVRARDFIPQLLRPTVVSDEMIGRGLFLIIAGLFKKVVISDFISINFVDRIFDSPTLYSGFENLIGVYGYALQIYCDFSGYSDMAIGLALLLGFRFNINFDSPYQSSSITEFWRRWHISLSSWLKDYLYISLGGNRKGNIRTYINLMITMVLGGLWHGASVRFILWGGWHGLLLALDKMFIKYIPLHPTSNIAKRAMKIAGGILTFHLVCFGWILFRADSMETVWQMCGQIAAGINWELLPEFLSGYRMVSLLMVVGYIIHLAPDRYEQRCTALFTRSPLFVKAISIAIFIFFLVQMRSSDIQPFIYFQF